MIQNQKQAISDNNEITLFPGLPWLFAGIVMAFLVGRFLPMPYAWGFNFWSIVSTSLSMVLLGTALFLVIPPVSHYLAVISAHPVIFVTALAGKINRYWLGSVTGIFLLGLFYIFRSEALVYGDSFTRLAACAAKEGPLLYGELFLETGAVIIPHYTYRLLSSWFGVSAQTTYAVLSSLAGVFGVWALYKIARVLAVSHSSRWFIFIAALTGGTVILFFGYVESYTLPTVLSLWSIYFTLCYLKGNCRLVPAVVAALGALFFHLIFTPFLVVVLLAPAVRNRVLREEPFSSLVLKINLTAVFLSFVIALVFQLTAYDQVFVPIWPTPENFYWFLSGAHLVDVANQLLLLSPVGVATGLLLLFSKRLRKVPCSPESALLGMTVVVTFLVAFWVNPKLGYMRDWDLLSQFGFPLALWGGYFLARALSEKQILTRALPASVVVALVVIVPNLIEKNDLATAVHRLDEKLWSDIHYQVDYRDGERCIPWGYILSSNVNEPERALKYFRRRYEIKKDDYLALSNIGEVYYSRGELDSAYSFLSRAVTLNPDNPRLYEQLAKVTGAMGNDIEAKGHAEKALRYKTDNPSALTQLGISLSKMLRFEEALVYFRRAFELGPDVVEHNLNLGIVLIDLQVFDSAYYYLNRGLVLSKGKLDNNPLVLFKIGVAEQALGNKTAALEHLQKSVALDRNNAKSQTQLGILLFELNRTAEALPLFRRAYELMPDNHEYVLNLAMLYSTLGQYDSAYVFLQKGIKMTSYPSSNPSVTVTLFKTCLALGKLDEAQKELLLLEQMYPGSVEVRKLRDAFEQTVKK